MKRAVFFSLFLLSFASAFLLENSALRSELPIKDANKRLIRKLEKKRVIQERVLSNPEVLAMVDGFDVNCDLYSALKRDKLSFQAYKHKCLVFWSDNDVQPYNFTAENKFEKRMLRNSKGWYQMVSLRIGDYDLYCYYPFYHRYPFNNAYFQNGFSQDLDFDEVEIVENALEPAIQAGAYEIHKTLPALNQADYSGKRLRRVVEFFYTLSFLCFSVFLFFAAGKRPNFNARLFVVGFAAFIAGFNLLAFFNVILKHKANIPLFSPELAAYSDFIPSLGHCILMSVAVLCLLLIIHQGLGFLKEREKGLSGYGAYITVSLLHWIISFYVILIILPSFILNSRINYDFKLLTNVTEYTLLGLFNVFLLFLFILLSNRILVSLIRNHLLRKPFFKVHLLTCIPIIATAWIIGKENGFLLLCFAAYGFLLPIWVLFVNKILFRHIMAIAFLTAAMFSVQFEQLNSFKEKENRKLFANKLIAKEDIDLEIKLLNIEKEMIHAAAIDSFFYYTKNDYQELELNYRYTFFSEFIRNYDISLMRYDSLGNDISPNKLTYAYVNDLYNQSTNKNISNYFLYIEDLHYLGGYLAKYEICPGLRNIGYVYLLLTPKIKSDQYTLDYFFSKMDNNHLADNRYSYAIYQKNELVRGLGTYPYKLSDHDRYRSMDDESFLEENGFSQLIKKIDNETFVLVSLKAATWNQIFTVFTFILLCFTAILIAVFILIYILIFIIGLFGFNPFLQRLYGVITQYLRVININQLYLETKIRLSFLLMSVLICSVVVYFTVQNVNKGFREKQSETLDKKMSQIVSELEFGYSKRDDRPMQNLIKHLANTYEVDINLYFKDGTLYQSANNRIYDEVWFSPYMHPKAHSELIQKQQYSIKQYEQIGLLEFQSFYNAIFDEDRNLIGYVHLPYFSKSLDLKREFSTYLGSLLNMSTLLLMISLLIASYFGQSLVRPLNLMIESLARIKVGGQNKAIDWSRNDEIGQLVEQYNIMLKKLEISTEKLAKSEREGAWKEMAKQVAHEIKNPLTPMKLHLQHLQMSLHRDDAHLKEKIAGISQILIEQIDQLSRMAEAFSSFAKMPLAVPQVCNLHQVLNSSVVLFRAQNNLDITYEESKETLPVYVDKDQIQRVFTNILKNAQQAAQEDVAVHISVRVTHSDGEVQVAFTDNGRGIESDLKDKIFQPNFSTKNSGMGLGLAICQKIIEQVNGRITFESEVNKGSTFYVILPVYKSDSLSNI